MRASVRSGIIRDHDKLFGTIDTYHRLDYRGHATGYFKATDSTTGAKKVTLTAHRVHR